MRRLRTAAVLASLALLLAGCPQQSDHSQPPAVEVEDCDAEDFANREADCGFIPPAATPTKMKTPTAPKPTKTPTRKART